MIKADELREFRPVVRYRDGSEITLHRQYRMHLRRLPIVSGFR